MITMTKLGENAKLHLPVCAAFVTEMRTTFPQATFSYVYGIRPLIEVVIPLGLVPEFQKLISKFYDTSGNVRDIKAEHTRDGPIDEPDYFKQYTEYRWPSAPPSFHDFRDDLDARREKMREELRAEQQRIEFEEFLRRQQERSAEQARERARKTQEEFTWKAQAAQEEFARNPWDEARRRATGQKQPSYGSSPPVSIDVKIEITKQYPHHAVLGLIPGAPAVVVRAAFRALALVYHPDKPGGSTEKMQKLNKAFIEVKKYERLDD